MKHLTRAINILTKSEQKKGLTVLMLASGMALLETAGIASIMPFLAVLGDPTIIDRNEKLKYLYLNVRALGVNDPKDFIFFLGMVSLILISASAVYKVYTQYEISQFIEMRRHTIGMRVVQRYIYLPYESMMDKHTGEMAKTILSEVDQFIQNVVRPSYNMITHSLVLIVIILFLTIISPLVTFASALLIVAIYSVIYLQTRQKLKKLGESLVDSNKKRFITSGELLTGIKEIKIYGKELEFLKKFEKCSEEYAQSYSKYMLINQIPKHVIEGVAFSSLIIIALMMIIFAPENNRDAVTQTLPLLGVFALSAYKMMPALNAIFLGIAGIRYGHKVIDNLHQTLKNFEIKDHIVTTEKLKILNNISISEVCFSYPSRRKKIIKNLNLIIPAQSFIGIVGQTGSGKTTLLDIILGLLNPNEGIISIDGIKVDNNNMRSWQKNIGYVSQNVHLADASLSENIAFGVSSDEINQRRVEECAKISQIHEFISKQLPTGYETNAGERGIKLSGGQKQRIVIARALYNDPDVLIFDEATSALDNETEKAMMDAIEALAGKKTIIMVAHRTTTLEKCDMIFEMNAGEIKIIGDYRQFVEYNKDNFDKKKE